MDHVQHLGCLLALVAEDAFLGVYHLEDPLVHFEHLGRAGVSDCVFLDVSQFDVLVKFDVRVGCEGGERDRRPLGVHLPNALLHLEFDANGLVLGQLDDWDAHLFTLVDFRVERHRQDWPDLLLFRLHLLEN